MSPHHLEVMKPVDYIWLIMNRINIIYNIYIDCQLKILIIINNNLIFRTAVTRLHVCSIHRTKTSHYPGCCQENCWLWTPSAEKTEGPAPVSWVNIIRTVWAKNRLHSIYSVVWDREKISFICLPCRKMIGCALSCSALTLVRVTAWRTGPRPKDHLAEMDKWVLKTASE